MQISKIMSVTALAVVPLLALGGDLCAQRKGKLKRAMQAARKGDVRITKSIAGHTTGYVLFSQRLDRGDSPDAISLRETPLRHGRLPRPPGLRG